MPPYFRFPEPEAIKQRFWGCRSRNPTCGFISLETGTKIFIWGNIIYAATFAFLSTLIFLLPLFMYNDYAHQEFESAQMHHEEKVGLKERSKLSRLMISSHMDHLTRTAQAVGFVSFFFVSWLLYISCKLKKAVIERDLPRLKKNYILSILLLALLIIPTGIECCALWSIRPFLIDVPWFIFEMMGIMFTHAFIVSLMSPDNGQQDDLNRIQFSP